MEMKAKKILWNLLEHSFILPKYASSRSPEGSGVDYPPAPTCSGEFLGLCSQKWQECPGKRYYYELLCSRLGVTGGFLGLPHSAVEIDSGEPCCRGWCEATIKMKPKINENQVLESVSVKVVVADGRGCPTRGVRILRNFTSISHTPPGALRRWPRLNPNGT